MHSSELKFLVLFAVVFRCILLVFQFTTNLVFEDFDSSTWIQPQQQTSQNNTKHGDVQSLILNGLAKWDSVYFLYIARYGYTYEQTLAFFPLFPYLVSFISNYIPFLNQYHAMQWVAFIINLISYTTATVYLYKLTYTISNNKKFSIISSVLFIVNPASVFMMSCYTESLFVCLQFMLLYYLEQRRYYLAACLISLSMLTRANGLLNIVFLIYLYLKNELRTQLELILRNGKSILVVLQPVVFMEFLFLTWYKFLSLFILILLSVIPYIFYQYEIYRTFCKLSHVVLESNHWCNNLVPFSYTYIQQYYWNVGFLRYWEMKQLPNFLLAAPIVMIVFIQVRIFLNHLQARDTIFFLGFIDVIRTKDKTKSGEFIKPSKLFVYLVHCLFLTIHGLLGFHVQILTRMLCSSSPIIYWACANLLFEYHKNNKRTRSKMITMYLLIYVFVGTLLHCNFYPWT